MSDLDQGSDTLLGGNEPLDTPQAERAPVDGASPPAPEPDAGADKPWYADDWREKMVARLPQAEQTKELARLKRYASPENVYKSHREMEAKLSSRQIKPTLGENPTSEEVTAYRKANGIPETPDGYELKFPEGVTASDMDKADLSAYAEEMHKRNVPPEIAKANLDVYVKIQEAAAQRRHEASQAAFVEAKSTLKAEYGRDYARNMQVADNFIAQYGGEDGRALMTMRLEDGTALGANTTFVRMMVEAALQAAGDESLAVAELGGGGRSVDDRIGELQELLKSTKKEDQKKYWSEGTQAELTKLYAAKEAAERRKSGGA